MAAANGHGPVAPNGAHHQRSKSSGLRSLMIHRRNNSQGSNLAAPSLIPGKGSGGPLEETSHNCQQPPILQAEKSHIYRSIPAGNSAAAAPTTPAKTITSPLAIPTHNSDSTKENRPGVSSPPPPSPLKKPRPKSTTGLAGLLSRPKSLKNLKVAKDALEAEREQEEGRGRARSRGDEHKRNKSRLGFADDRGATSQASPALLPQKSAAASTASTQMPPIYAQFCTSDKVLEAPKKVDKSLPSYEGSALDGKTQRKVPTTKPRPKSFHPVPVSTNNNSAANEWPKHTTAKSSVQPTSSEVVETKTHTPSMQAISPDDIDAHLEALLDRRNIPQHQRYKMRNLTATIKMELIRQDWAEERLKRLQQSSIESQSYDSVRSMSDGSESEAAKSMLAMNQADRGSSEKSSKSKHTRAKSLTLSKVTRGRSCDRGGSDSSKRPKSPWSSQKKRIEGTLGRHLWTKSTENLSSTGGIAISPDALSPSSLGGVSNPITGFFARSKGSQQNSPADFVTYMRTIRAPEKVEVGKLHKLRLLLRNETVTWIEEFIGQGGMEEVVALLHRILAIEWREEHEDALLHENLLCLKALCTTALALQYLHSIQASLLPLLIHMIFDPEKKGPSEFTTRNIVTWVLFTYIQNAPMDERSVRAHTLLSYLRDPERHENEKPVSFVMDMHKERPFRVWCKEVVSVTKEVFWIFLHHLNVIALPSDTSHGDKLISATDEDIYSSAYRASILSAGTEITSPLLKSESTEPTCSYMLRHFPKERPPVPAAPYVGGVEWEATNYLASHLDLVNAVLACIPTTAERNEIRNLMKLSGWERCMGGSLRLCKEKFYAAVHDGLRAWVAAAHEDGWDVRDVRYGPPPPPTGPTAKRRNSLPRKGLPTAGQSRVNEPAPKLEMPKMDFILDDNDLQIKT
ncbi:hypothetical protein SEPCBS119000_001355 [Sporothrix epigloea]|uniref:Formin GTPase-binding domain-containing protein n=1 Tax=Sporothrix epigloea TaxID=1892477 RepID=A0ABP0DA82_9PEZI